MRPSLKLGGNRLIVSLALGALCVWFRVFNVKLSITVTNPANAAETNKLSVQE